MIINHTIDMDLVNPGPVPRIQVKQGDARSRNIIINLFANGEPWEIPEDAEAVIRYHHHDPQGMTDAQGIFDTLEDGSPAWLFRGNVFEVMPPQALLENSGLTQMDVTFLCEGRTLSTFNFEIYVNRAPASGTEPAMQNYYKVARLDQINAAFDKIYAAIEAMGGGEYL